MASSRRLFLLSCLLAIAAGGKDGAPAPASPHIEAHPTRRLIKLVEKGHPSGATTYFRNASAREAPTIVVRDDRVEEGTLPTQHGELQVDTDIEWSEPDYIATAAAIRTSTSDPLVPWSFPKTNIYDAWTITKGADTIRACVIDSGVDASHEDLQGRIHAGYDAILRQPGHVDTNGHGTMVAGILAASPDNWLGIPGVLWQGQVDSCRFLGEDGRGYLSDAIECLRWCIVEQKARLVSNSWGTYGRSKALRETMEYYAEAYGVMFVAASGNEAVNNDDPNVAMYPASYDLPSILSVAATTKFGTLASFSNYASRGESVDISAPGVDIVSTFPGNKYKTMSGTSFSVPLVTGTLALMLSSSSLSAAGPGKLSTAELKQILLGSSMTSPLLDGMVGGRRSLDAFEAVRRASMYVPAAEDVLDDRIHNNATNAHLHPVYEHAHVVDASSVRDGRRYKSELIGYPGTAMVNESALTHDIFDGCPSSRYRRYDIKGLLADVLIPKHVFAIDNTDAVTDGYRYLQFDTCAMKKPFFDSIIVVLDCTETARGSGRLEECRCLRSNDGCGTRRAGSKVRARLAAGHRYVAVVFATDPLEKGSYKLRLRPQRPQ